MNTFKGTANASTSIMAPPERVWQALTDPALVREYLYGAEIKSDWKQGSPITFKGEWKGKPYEDKGEILEIEPGRRLKVTHFSPLSGQPDVPENYHVVTYAVTGSGDTSTLTITQENNRDQNEVDESEKTWGMILGNIKTLLEK
jgi:uncharacterized protein YndB with AHSA1/START domain